MLANKKRKLMIIILSIVLVILIVLSGLIALYFTTDMFKSNTTLFSKYIVQNIDNMYNILESKPTEIEQMLEQSKLTSNLKAKVHYKDSENNEENSINKAELDISGQIDNAQNYQYEDIRLAYENEEAAKLEYIKDGQDCGIRLNGIKQFVTFQNDNLQELELKTGRPSKELEMYRYLFEPITIANFAEFTSSETEVLRSTYLGIITQNTKKENYQKKSNVEVTVNGKKYKANGYSIKLKKEQFNDLMIKILEKVSKDEIILGKMDNIQNQLEKYQITLEENTTLRKMFVKMIENKIEEIKDNNIGQEETEITVYESNGNTIKTDIKTPDSSFSIDLYENKSGIQFQYQNTVDNKTKQNNIAIQNSVTESSQNMLIRYTLIEDDIEKNTLDFQINRKKEDEKLNGTYQIKYNVEGNEAEISIEHYLTQVNEFENKVELSEENNMSLNNLEQGNAQKIVEIMQNTFNSQVETVLEKIKLDDINTMLKQLKILKETELKFENTTEEVVSEAERNRFNSQLTLFIGKDVNVDTLKQLLEITNGTLKDVQTIYDEEEKNKDKKVLKGFIIDIKRNSGNEEKKQEMIKTLEENKNKNFTVAMSYDENTKLINKITIVSNEYLNY